MPVAHDPRDQRIHACSAGEQLFERGQRLSARRVVVDQCSPSRFCLRGRFRIVDLSAETGDPPRGGGQVGVPGPGGRTRSPRGSARSPPQPHPSDRESSPQTTSRCGADRRAEWGRRSPGPRRDARHRADPGARAGRRARAARRRAPDHPGPDNDPTRPAPAPVHRALAPCARQQRVSLAGLDGEAISGVRQRSQQLLRVQLTVQLEQEPNLVELRRDTLVLAPLVAVQSAVAGRQRASQKPFRSSASASAMSSAAGLRPRRLRGVGGAGAAGSGDGAAGSTCCWGVDAAGSGGAGSSSPHPARADSAIRHAQTRPGNATETRRRWKAEHGASGRRPDSRRGERRDGRGGSRIDSRVAMRISRSHRFRPSGSYPAEAQLAVLAWLTDELWRGEAAEQAWTRRRHTAGSRLIWARYAETSACCVASRATRSSLRWSRPTPTATAPRRSRAP